MPIPRFKLEQTLTDRNGTVQLIFSHEGCIPYEQLGLFVNNMEDYRFIRPEDWEPKDRPKNLKEDVGMTLVTLVFKPDTPAPVVEVVNPTQDDDDSPRHFVS